MYCVIQKIENKKPNEYGAEKELKVDWYSFGIEGVTKTKYGYKRTGGRFERPIKTAYKISIHESYRKNGKVKKKQWSICTMGYYDLIDSWYGDFTTLTRLNTKLEKMGISEEELYDMIDAKLDPIIEKVKKEFEQTEEYKTKKKHEEIISEYQKKKAKFENTYGSNTYDYCYDVFGELRNEEYLKQLKQSKQREEESYKRSYQSDSRSNYSYDNFSSYFKTSHSNYNDNDKAKLKKIFRLASKNFHPDVTGAMEK